MQAIISLVARRSIKLAEQFAAAVSVAAMNSSITIKRPTTDSFNEAARAYVQPASALIYAGVAGLTPASGPITMDLGDEPTYYSSITCYVPDAVITTPRIDDIITVTEHDDADFIGRVFRVTDVRIGGRVNSSIQLSATGIAPSKQWS